MRLLHTLLVTTLGFASIGLGPGPLHAEPARPGVVAAHHDPAAQPPLAASTPATPPAQVVPATQPSTPPSADELAEASAAHSECYRDCYADDLTASNRETCKLECDSLANGVFKASESRDAAQMQTDLSSCLVECLDEPNVRETDRATCLLTCADNVEVPIGPPKDPMCTVIRFTASGASYEVHYLCPVTP